MIPVRRVAAINDLSGFGRCSLTVSLPVLSAMGFQVCPVPTVILSAHTGYESPYIHDFTAAMEPYLQHWQQLALTFDGVYTGYLGDERQATVLEPFLIEQKAAGKLVLVDPAMADHGRLYASCTPGLVGAMGRLAAVASVVTPNLTEACLLTGTDYREILSLSGDARRRSLETIGQRLLAMGCGAAVVTGVPAGEEGLENWIFPGAETVSSFVSTRRVERHFAGTGDVFASVLCGWLLRGEALEQAVARTADFVYRCAAYTATTDGGDQDGIAFEPYLRELCP